MQFTKALQHTVSWKVLNTILTFSINLLLVRLLGAEGSGVFFYSIALLSFFILLISWSMEAGITYFGSFNQDSIPSITLFIFPCLVVQAILSWALLRFIPVIIQPQLSWLYIISNLVIIYFSALYYAKKWFLSINLIVCAVNGIVLIILGWLYTMYGIDQGKLTPFNNDSGAIASIHLAAIVYFTGLLLQATALALIFFIRSGVKVTNRKYDPALIKNIFRYSSIAFISNILFFLVTRIDYYFVQKYCSEIELSNYVQVSKAGQLLVLLPAMIAGVIFPYSSSPDKIDYLPKLQSLCRVIGILFIPVSFLVIIFGYWLFPWLFGSGFRMMYPSMLFYLPGFYFLSLVSLLAAHLAGKALLKKNMIASCIALVAVISGDVLLIPTAGIYAAAAVSSISYFICMVYLLWVYKKNFNCRPTDFLVPGNIEIQLLIGRNK